MKIKTVKMLTVNGGRAPIYKDKLQYFPVVYQDLLDDSVYLKKIKDGRLRKYSTRNLAQMIGVKESILVEMLKKAQEERDARYNNSLDPSSVVTGAPISDTNDTIRTSTDGDPEEEDPEGSREDS